MLAANRFAVEIAAVASWLLVPTPGWADVYKCAGDGGIPVYQEMPCTPGKELRNFQTDPPPLTILPAQVEPSNAPAAAKEPARSAKAESDAKSRQTPHTADASERKHIRIGMTEAEVEARLGHPDMTAGGRNGAPARWTYLPAPADPETITTLTLAKGAVTGVERRIVKK